MIYVFPVSTSDASLIDSLYAAIKHLGGMKGRKCMVVADQPAREHADWLTNRLEHADATVETHIFPFACNDGWPRSCNRYFVGAASLLAKQPSAFFYFELDNTPIRPGWLDKIEGEYIAGLARSQFFMGRMAPHKENRMGQWVDNGQVMNGSGVYPSDYIVNSVLAREVARQSVPWDVYMRWEIVKQCKDASEFILFNWRSTNYRWENGILTCDVSSRPDNVVHSGKADPVLPGTFLVHGCKDGSLSRLVLSGEIDGPKQLPQGGQVVSRQAHTLENVGSNPIPATLQSGNGTQGDPAPGSHCPVETNRVAKSYRNGGKARIKAKRAIKLSDAERARRSAHALDMVRKRIESKNLKLAAA